MKALKVNISKDATVQKLKALQQLELSMTNQTLSFSNIMKYLFTCLVNVIHKNTMNVMEGENKKNNIYKAVIILTTKHISWLKYQIM